MNISPIDFSGLYEPNKVLFERYRDLLIKWNKRFNLTSIDDPDKINELHFLDSISVSAILQPYPSPVSRETFVLDIGSGAGFPGIPIKIIRPDIKLTIVDSVKKKCDFVKEVVRSIGLHDVEVIHKRLTGHEQIGEFDVVVSRAAFKMPDLIRYAIKNLRSGGLIVGMKKEDISGEITECDQIIKQYKLSPIEQLYYKLPASGQVRSLVITRRI